VRELIAKYLFKDVFTINTFGFGKVHDPQTMSAIAHMKDGNYYNIQDSKHIQKIFC